jgi:DNA primase
VPLIPPETVEQIIAANDIVEVVSGYFPLKRRGAQYWATCPFHQERSASFSVNSQRQIFKCFGCGAGGNVIRFVRLYENLDYVPAVKKLAERAGIKLVEAEMSAEDTARLTMRRRLLALHAEAAEFFHQQLMKKQSAQIARDYLKGRGIGGETAKNWKIGYAPDGWDAMRDFGQAQGFSDEELVASGLVKLRDEEQPHGEFYDRFRARVMFPICDDTGNVIAFSGRVLVAEVQAAKYVNSPETMLFKKGEVLFGLHKSKRAIIKSGSACVLEGQLDLITAFEAGVENVVAPQGTAFTERQARKIKQCFAEGIGEVVLCFDADAAGEKAAERSLAALLFSNISVRVAEMPAGEDPDSMIRGKGAAAFMERIAAAKDFFDFQIDRLALREDFATPRGKMQAAQKMAGSISLISDAMLREAVMHKLSTRLEISMAEFARLLKLRTAKPLEEDAPAEVPEEERITLDPTARLLALVALHDAAARSWILEEPWDRVLADAPDSALLVKILGADLDPAQPGTIHTFLTTLSAAEEAVVSGLLEEAAPDHPLAVAHDCWQSLEKRKIRLRMEAIQARMRTPELESAEVIKLQKEVLDLQKRLSDIARPLSPPL